VKAIDSNLLVYASLESHPATSVCETYIAGHLSLACAAEGIAVENPIDAAVRASYGVDFNDDVLLETCRRRGTAVLATDDTQQMTNWENQNLPAKGLSRILLAVHRWIEQRDSAMAASFHAETQSLSSLV
jgi:hypothetical protein